MEPRVVDNRVFLLGLDVRYREAMKWREGTELLACARATAASQALLDTRPRWTIPVLTAAAAVAARSSDDCSLVGLAARAQDSVVLCALRESTVLYVVTVFMGRGPTSPPKFVWAVDPDLVEPAGRFIQTFNTLFEERLPAAQTSPLP